MDHFCYLCFVFDFVILSCLFLAAYMSPVGNGLTFGSIIGCGVFLCFMTYPYGVL